MKYQIALAVALLISSGVSAETDSLKTFKAGDRVKASEVNANFALIKKMAEDAAQAAADAGSFDGLNDVYEGVTSDDALASSSDLRFGAQGESIKQVARPSQFRFSAQNSDDETVIPCSEDDPNCVITGGPRGSHLRWNAASPCGCAKFTPCQRFLSKGTDRG